jgi:hypothetical protein
MINISYYPFEKINIDTADEYYSPLSGRIREITDFTGRTAVFTYDDNSADLTAIQFAGRTVKYTYSSLSEDIRQSHNLLSGTDPKSQDILAMIYKVCHGITDTSYCFIRIRPLKIVCQCFF